MTTIEHMRFTHAHRSQPVTQYSCMVLSFALVRYFMLFNQKLIWINLIVHSKPNITEQMADYTCVRCFFKSITNNIILSLLSQCFKKTF